MGATRAEKEVYFVKLKDLLNKYSKAHPYFPPFLKFMQAKRIDFHRQC